MAKDSKSNVGLSMVMLDQSRMAPAEAFRQRLAKALPEETVTIDEKKDGLYFVDIGRTSVLLAFMPVPIPWNQLESLARAAWHWPEAENVLRRHRAHILVTIMHPPPDVLEAALLLTKITAAVLEVQQGVAVLWGGPALSSREIFLAEAANASREKHLPVLLWVSFNLLKDGDEYAIVTQGMEKLGHKEMELLGNAQSQGALEFALDMAVYVLKRGPVLKAGETFGPNAQERFLISYRPWRWDPSKTALVLDMRSPQPAAKGFLSRLFGRK